MSALEVTAPSVDASVAEALALHRSWLETRGREGRRANFSDRSLGPLNLEGCDLRKAVLVRCDLSGASLDGANLENADLTEATLAGARFRETNLREACLFNADLEGADLSHAKSLRSAQLRGCNLSHAALPATITFHGIDQANQALARIAVQFVSVVSLCLYSLLIIGSTKDVDLITNASSVTFPLIDLALPILGFYLLVPIFLPAVAAAFYLHLSTFWDSIGTLPAYFPDGSEVTARTPPTVLDRLIEMHMVRLRATRDTPANRLYVALISAGLFGIVPVTLFAFWLRYLPRHDAFGTGLHLIILFAFLIYSSFLGLSMKAKLRITGEERSLGPALRRVVLCTVIFAALAVISLQTLYGSRLPVRFAYAALGGEALSKNERAWSDKSGGAETALATNLSRMNLRHADMTAAFAENVDLSGSTLEHGVMNYAVLRRASLRNADLRKASLRGSQLQGADLRRARLAGAVLHDANLTRTNFTQADLHGANLSGAVVANANFSRANLGGHADAHGISGESAVFSLAEMEKSRLSRAVLPKADFFLANLRETHLWKANLQGATFIFADLTGANLTQADLAGANFSQANLRRAVVEKANLQNAQFVFAQLYDAVLTGADLTGANLKGAQLRGAVLRQAQLRGADLTDALLEAADLEGADLRGVNLSLTSGLTAEQLQTALLDAQTIFPRALAGARPAP